MHRSSPIALVDHISAIRSTTLAWITAAMVAVPLVATAIAAPIVDIGLIAGAVLGGAAGVGAFAVRRRIQSLPLELAGTACRGEVGGYPAYRFRVRLGRGRIFTDGTARVTYCEGSATTELPVVLDRVGVGVGPWTLVVVDTERVVGAAGRFEVRVEVSDAGRVWQASQSYTVADLATGRFGADLTTVANGLHVDPDRWDVVQSEVVA